MTEWQADVPDKYILGDSWGLGWIRFGWDGRRLIGHDGNTIGQAAFLRLLPDAGLAVTLLTNGGNTRDLYEDLYREVFAELADVAMPTPLEPPADPPAVDITPHLGHLRARERADRRAGRRRRPGAANDDHRPDRRAGARAGSRVPDGAPSSRTSSPCERRRRRRGFPVTFYSLPTGESYMHFGARATPKTG